MAKGRVVLKRVVASEQPCQLPLQLLEAKTAAWRICKMLLRCTLNKKGHTPEGKQKQEGLLCAFQGGAEVRSAVPAGLQPVLVCYLEATEGGKSPSLEVVPPLIYSEAFIIELIFALQRDCQYCPWKQTSACSTDITQSLALVLGSRLGMVSLPVTTDSPLSHFHQKK